jgi:hypothetical protein
VRVVAIAAAAGEELAGAVLVAETAAQLVVGLDMMGSGMQVEKEVSAEAGRGCTFAAKAVVVAPVAM